MTIITRTTSADDGGTLAATWLVMAPRGPRSFVVMRRERLGEALAFDGDLSAAGFVEVRP
jgi:hypothetical protein